MGEGVEDSGDRIPAGAPIRVIDATPSGPPEEIRRMADQLADPESSGAPRNHHARYFLSSNQGIVYWMI